MTLSRPSKDSICLTCHFGQSQRGPIGECRKNWVFINEKRKVTHRNDEVALIVLCVPESVLEISTYDAG